MTYSYEWSHIYVSSVKIYILVTLEETTAIVNAEIVIFRGEKLWIYKFSYPYPPALSQSWAYKIRGGGPGFGPFHTANAPKSWQANSNSFVSNPKSDIEWGAGSKVAILDNIDVFMSFRSLRSPVEISTHDRNRKFIAIHYAWHTTRWNYYTRRRSEKRRHTWKTKQRSGVRSQWQRI